jgi:hypothetical protein
MMLMLMKSDWKKNSMIRQLRKSTDSAQHVTLLDFAQIDSRNIQITKPPSIPLGSCLKKGAACCGFLPTKSLPL